MLDIFFKLIIIFITIIGLYYATCYILKLLTGCDYEEAVVKIQRFFNGTAMYSFNNDIGFANEIWETVKNIIGDTQYSRLEKLSRTAISPPLLSFGYYSGLPYIAIAMYYEDDNQKQVLENILTDLVCSYLRIYGYGTNIMVDWKNRSDLKMPYILFRYAQTKEEQRIIELVLKNSVKPIIAVNTDITDDTEDDDLND